MSIVLFAIIGATINANPWYWICFGVMGLARILTFVFNLLIKE